MSVARWRVDCLVGARPNFVKIAPIMRALAADARFSVRLLHTGQHYDAAMSGVFFEELGIPAPAANLEASGGDIDQIARVMTGLAQIYASQRPHLLLIVGDVNSTLAAALAGVKLGVPLAHVEAGLRSRDRAMPEEINRLVVDRLSDLLLITEPDARRNLLSEGCAPERIVFVGNVMIDSLHFALARAAPPEDTLRAAGWGKDAAAHREGFGLVTLHRPSNVDDPARLAALFGALLRISQRLPLLFPAHPRTRAAMARAGIAADIASGRLRITPPLAYLQMVSVMRAARLVITDSGGVQEETTALGAPCLTYRDNTERPITISDGTNRLVGADPAALEAATLETLAAPPGPARIPQLWDGRAAPRIVEAVAEFLAQKSLQDA